MLADSSGTGRRRCICTERGGYSHEDAAREANSCPDPVGELEPEGEARPAAARRERRRISSSSSQATTSTREGERGLTDPCRPQPGAPRVRGRGLVTGRCERIRDRRLRWRAAGIVGTAITRQHDLDTTVRLGDGDAPARPRAGPRDCSGDQERDEGFRLAPRGARGRAPPQRGPR